MQPETQSDLYRQFVEQTPDYAFLCLDADGRIVEWNGAAASLFGLRAADAIGKPGAIIFTPEDVEARVPEREIDRARREGRADDIRWHLRQDGTRFWASGVMQRVSVDGREHFVKMVRDETRRHEAERRMRESQERLELTEQITHVVTFDWNLVEESVEFGGDLRNVFGFSPSGWQPMNAERWREMIYPPDRERVRSAFARAVDGAQDYDVEFRIVWPDGSVHWLWGIGRVFFGPDGKAKRMLGIHQEITTRKRAEQALREKAELLEEKVGLLDLASDAVLAADLISKIHYWNLGAERLYGWTEREALGKVSHQLLRTRFPVSREALQEELFRTGRWEGELTHVTRDGREIVVASRWAVLRDPDGRPLRILETNSDITERKAAEDRLHRLAQDLRRSNAELEQFAYVASHDMKEPLRMVASFLGLLRRRFGAALPAEANQYIDFAVDGAYRMQRLIEDLLQYARVGTQRQRVEPIDVGILVERVTQGLQVALEESGAEVSWDRLPTVSGDPVQLDQLFQNLIANAIKFRGGDRPAVQVEAEELPDEWLFRVRDNGIGFDMRYAERIFESFRRLHSKDQYPGTGLGLAVCRKIVERHGGRIWAESAIGTGSVFSFTLAKEGPRGVAMAS